MATLATQTITRAGVQGSLTAAAGGGDAMACGPANFLYVNNGGGAPITVTLVVPSALVAYGEVISNRAVSVTNGTFKLIGPIIANLYQDPTTGLCTITYSGVTTVTVGAFAMNPGA